MNWTFSIASTVVLLGTLVAWIAFLFGWHTITLDALLVAFTGYVVATIVLNRLQQ